MHALPAVALPQTRMGALPGLCCVRSGFRMDAEHAHRDQRRASRASRNDAHAHACPGPPPANPSDRRTRCTSPGTDHAAVLCDPICVQPLIHQACKDVAFNVVHARGMDRSAAHAAERAAGSARGPGRGQALAEDGEGQELLGAVGRGVHAVVRQQLEASPSCTAWSRAVHGKTRWKGRGVAGRTLAGLCSRSTGRVDGAGQHRLGGGALSRVAVVEKTCRPRAAPALRVFKERRDGADGAPLRGGGGEA